MSLVLNSEQQDIFDYVTKKFVSSPDKFLIINAPSGSGKTTLIAKITEKICRCYPSKKYFILVPTNKAKHVVSKKLKPFKNLKILTIHQFFSSSRVILDDGECIFPLDTATHKSDLVIIDEASMVDTQMFNNFKKANIKILLTCDEYQLPPIKTSCTDETGNAISPIFDLDCKVMTLTRCIRNENSGIFSYIKSFRENVKLEDKMVIDVDELGVEEKHMVDAFNEDKDCVVITYTNKRKDYWNDYVRSAMFGKQSVEKIIQDEKLIFTGMRSTENKIYRTSDIIQCLEVEVVTVRMYFIVLECPCNPNDDKEIIIPCSRCGIVGKDHAWYDIKFYRVYDQYNNEWHIPLDDTHVNEISEHFRTFIFSKPANHRKELWIKYYDWINLWNPSLDYIYSITCHKSQGSEWDIVYMDYYNLSLAKKDIKYKLLYTAASRTKKELYVL